MKLDFLQEERSMPAGHGEDRVVQWHVFRSIDEARTFAGSIRLSAGQSLTGGQARDSVGVLYWIGVAVEDVERWGNRAAVNKHGASS